MRKSPSITRDVAEEPTLPDGALFRKFADNIPTLAWIANPDGYITWYNRRWHDYCGTSPEEMEGWGWQSVHDPAVLPAVMENWQGSIAAGKDFEMTFPLRGADGQYRPFLTRVTCTKDKQGRVLNWFGNNIDVTDRHAAQMALAENEAYLRLLLDSSAEAFYAVDRAGVTTLCNATFLAMMGFASQDQVIGRKLHSVIHHHHPDGSAYDVEDCPIYICADRGETAHVEDELFFRVDGTPVAVEYWVRPIIVDGQHRGAICTFLDISQRVATEKRNGFLIDLTDRLRDVGDPDGILRITTQNVGEFLGVSVCAYADMDPDQNGFTIRGDWSAPGSKSIVGHYHLADFGKMAVANLGDGRPLIINDNSRELAPEEAATFQAIGIMATICMPLVKDGRLTALMAIHDSRPRVWTDEELAVIRDVTERAWAHIERVRVEAELRASEEQFRVFAQATPNQLWAARPDGDLYWFNRQVIDYSGHAQEGLTGSGWGTLVHPDDIDRAGEVWARCVASGDVYEVEIRIRRHDGEFRWFLVRAEPTRDSGGAISGWVGSNTDIEDQRRQAAALETLAQSLESQVAERTSELMSAEEALHQSQKMEAVGQLTGGLAHDFNNLLTAISGGLEMIAMRIAQGRTDDIERYSNAAQTAAKRAAALTHRLLAFSRRQTLDPKLTDVNRLVGGMEELVRRTVGPAVEFEVVGAAGLWPVLVDQNQLENALLNLVINARDAMPDGGRLTIETGNRWLDPRAARERDLEPGQYVSLCVSDSGSGMTPEVIAKAFDPFFTTKPLGVGTGLGLSMIYGFARQSGGQVRIYSDDGQGTMVCVYLPRSHGTVESGAGEGDAPALPRAAAGDTVLVVDDEAGIRMLITDILEELGYQSLEAEDGQEGLAILQSDARIDLLITDVGLPGGMNGRQMADAARLARSDLKVLFITGYAENAVIGNGQLDPGMHVMTKPFELDSLGRRIKELIDQ